MIRALRLALLGLGSLTIIGFSPVTDSANLRDCVNGVCTMRMTAPQLIHQVETLVVQRRFDEARPLLAALRQASEFRMQTNFLEGYVAAETGNLNAAETSFRAVLRDRPELTRARLELARVLMLEGKDAAADHHYRLAEEAKDLPPEIERTIREQRGIIRNRRNWYFNFDVGLAPDSNVNGATNASTIDTVFSYNGQPIVMDLNKDARRKSGIGQTASVQGGVRLRLSDGLAMAIDGNGNVINQPGTKSDDVSALLAAGPEVTLKGGTRVTMQAVGVGHWYGGRNSQSGGGGRLSIQQDLKGGQRIGGQFDARRVTSAYSQGYEGWQFAGYGTYERVVGRTMVTTVTGFVRRESLLSPIYSNTEIGGNAGVGGELRHGINAGFSLGISRARYDEADFFFSAFPRRDWRFNARAYAGFRSIRVLGFSPELVYTFSKISSNSSLYTTTRNRIEFSLARYF